jgi:hypothetical protein
VQSSLDSPVLLIIFNRPYTTRRVFEAIRKQRPGRLFIAADGPRVGCPEDAEKCLAARSVVNDVDWKCDLKTLFSEKNIGCGRGPANAISWFFTHVEEGIILEDDCLPSDDFFMFCRELLGRYRCDCRVMDIGGTNLLAEPFKRGEFSYHFSNHNMIWGWATWKRAWDLYDFEMKVYKKIRDAGYLNACFNSYHELDYFRWIFDKTVANIKTITWWDYQWEFARRINSGLTIVPRKNLVVNLGIGNHATHTRDPHGAGWDLKFEPLNFPLVHPDFVLADKKRDDAFFRTALTTGMSRFKSSVKKVMPKFVLDLRSSN